MNEQVNRKAIGTLGHGAATISVAGTALKDFAFADPYHVFIQKPDADGLSPFVVGTLSGGLVGGDRLELTVTADQSANVQICAQAAERVYKTETLDVHCHQVLTATNGSWLEVLPSETIVFDSARLQRRFDLQLDSSSEMLTGDMLVLGRHAMGETVETAALDDLWQVRVHGELKWMERFGYDGQDLAQVLKGDMIANGMRCMATLLYIGDKCDRALESLRIVGSRPDCRFSVTNVNGVVIARIFGTDPLEMRKLYADCWMNLRSDLKGFERTMPTIWTV